MELLLKKHYQDLIPLHQKNVAIMIAKFANRMEEREIAKNATVFTVIPPLNLVVEQNILVKVIIIL